MNRSLDLSFHGWRGIGPDVQPDLFEFRWRLGFVTASLCKVCVLDAYEKLRGTIAETISTLEQRCREGNDYDRHGR